MHHHDEVVLATKLSVTEAAEHATTEHLAVFVPPAVPNRYAIRVPSEERPALVFVLNETRSLEPCDRLAHRAELDLRELAEGSAARDPLVRGRGEPRLRVTHGPEDLEHPPRLFADLLLQEGGGYAGVASDGQGYKPLAASARRHLMSESRPASGSRCRLAGAVSWRT